MGVDDADAIPQVPAGGTVGEVREETEPIAENEPTLEGDKLIGAVMPRNARKEVMSCTTRRLFVADDGRTNLLLMDSGAFMHVCPPTFAPHVPVERVSPMPKGVTADGRTLTCHGVKRVKVRVWGGRVLTFTFAVMDVSRALLSVGELRAQGIATCFTTHSYLKRGAWTTPLLRVRNLLFLPVLLFEQEEWPHAMGDTLKDAQKTLDNVILAVEEPQWHVVEYCCEPDSKLSTWFAERGHTVTRLGLPDRDLSNAACVSQVSEEIREQLQNGKKILLWASLPCRPWCKWQQASRRTSLILRQQNDKDRRQSRLMVQLFVKLLQEVLIDEQDHTQVVACFEWPRGALGWQIKEMTTLLELLPVACRFDGCRYGLRAQTGQRMCKPWRVQTNLPALQQPLSLRCGRDHQHTVTHGPDATRSGLYTPAMVETIGQAILDCEDEVMALNDMGMEEEPADTGGASSSHQRVEAEEMMQEPEQ